MDTRRKLNVFCTFSLRPVSRGRQKEKEREREQRNLFKCVVPKVVHKRNFVRYIILFSVAITFVSYRFALGWAIIKLLIILYLRMKFELSTEDLDLGILLLLLSLSLLLLLLLLLLKNWDLH